MPINVIDTPAGAHLEEAWRRQAHCFTKHAHQCWISSKVRAPLSNHTKVSKDA